MRYYISGHTTAGQPVFFCGADEEGIPRISTDSDEAFVFASHLEASLRAEWLNDSIKCNWAVHECRPGKEDNQCTS